MTKVLLQELLFSNALILEHPVPCELFPVPTPRLVSVSCEQHTQPAPTPSCYYSQQIFQQSIMYKYLHVYTTATSISLLTKMKYKKGPVHGLDGLRTLTEPFQTELTVRSEVYHICDWQWSGSWFFPKSVEEPNKPNLTISTLAGGLQGRLDQWKHLLRICYWCFIAHLLLWGLVCQCNASEAVSYLVLLSQVYFILQMDGNYALGLISSSGGE